jgi:hypothetical protein
MFFRFGETAMLSPQQIAAINGEIEKLEYARKNCADFGIQKMIDRWITDQKMKLESGDSPKHLDSESPAQIPSKPSE